MVPRYGLLKGAEVNRKLAQDHLGPAIKIAKELRDIGATYQEIADRLNQRGYRTRFGRRFTNFFVWQILNR